MSRRISPPFPHMQHRYWQQPLIIPGTPTAIHNCHSHYNLHLGHCETVACVSTALLRRLSLIQLYSVDVYLHIIIPRAYSQSRKEHGTGNSECRKEHGKSAPGISLTLDQIRINWRAARDSRSHSTSGRCFSSDTDIKQQRCRRKKKRVCNQIQPLLNHLISPRG